MRKPHDHWLRDVNHPRIFSLEDYEIGDAFFTKFFEKLIGRGDIRTMIEQGKSAAEIKATWSDDVKRFKAQRRKYLLYAE